MGADGHLHLPCGRILVWHLLGSHMMFRAYPHRPLLHLLCCSPHCVVVRGWKRGRHTAQPHITSPATWCYVRCTCDMTDTATEIFRLWCMAHMHTRVWNTHRDHTSQRTSSYSNLLFCTSTTKSAQIILLYYLYPFCYYPIRYITYTALYLITSQQNVVHVCI